MALYKSCAVAMKAAVFPKFVRTVYSSFYKRDFVSRVFLLLFLLGHGKGLG